MKKDVIYIDTEDDITTIIDKVKGAGSGIVALVPPKRIGVLQSIVNLKLLQRAASHADKRIVLITNDVALTGLAGEVALPIAKNLQSKPELTAPSEAVNYGDDVINGEELEGMSLDVPAEVANDTPRTTPRPVASAAVVDKPTNGAVTPVKKKPSAGIGIPNFNVFRKKLFLFGGLGILFVVFLVWAIVFAGRADVTIAAKTNIVNINKTLLLRPNATLDVGQAVLPAVIKQVKKTASVDFQPTGKKDVGEKAVGSLKLSNASDSSKTLPAGTSLTSNSGLVFKMSAAVTIPAATLSFSCPGYICPGTANGTVAAEAPGTKYNGASGALNGEPGGVSAVFTDATAGGTDKTVPVVTDDDVAKAKDLLKTQDANTVKDELKKQFQTDEVGIDEAFSVDAGTPTSTPAVGAEMTTSAAKLTAETTYTLVGVKRSDLKAVYGDYLKTQLKDDTTQKVYDFGERTTQFSQFMKTDQGYSVKAATPAQIGPNIDDEKLASDIKGKRIGEVQQLVGAIQGVDSVDVKLSPFWVTTVPNDAKRITINFSIKDEK